MPMGRSTSDQPVEVRMKLVARAKPLDGVAEKAPPSGGPLMTIVVEATLKTPIWILVRGA